MPLLTTYSKLVVVNPTCKEIQSTRVDVKLWKSGSHSTDQPDAKGLIKAQNVSVSSETRKPLGSRPLASPLSVSGLLTLLSKCFSTFPQGTCLLSISCQYLAMDGGYHPVCALLPKSVTQLISTVRKLWTPKTGLSPSVACLSRHLRRSSLLVKTTMHNSKQQATSIHISGCSLFARRY